MCSIIEINYNLNHLALKYNIALDALETLSLAEQTEVVWASFSDAFHVSHVHGMRCQDTLGRLCPSMGLYSVT